MGYVSPGRLYLEKQKTVETYEDVLAYAEFLRAEAGLDGVLPVDLQKILTHFQIPEPEPVPLPQQQGLLLDSERGIILINSKDPLKRQKFTTAHELVEMLFAELPQGKDLGRGWWINKPGGFKEGAKEAICNWTAANLLMPIDYVKKEIKTYGVTFECARHVADTCDVSLTSALVQIARTSMSGYFVVLWKLKHKPADLAKKKAEENQMTLFRLENTEPPKKLRVEWCLNNKNAIFLPKHKSTEKDSFIHESWERNIFTQGRVNISLDGRNTTWFYSENMSVFIEDERCVISLMRKI